MATSFSIISRRVRLGTSATSKLWNPRMKNVAVRFLTLRSAVPDPIRSGPKSRKIHTFRDLPETSFVVIYIYIFSFNNKKKKKNFNLRTKICTALMRFRTPSLYRNAHDFGPWIMYTYNRAAYWRSKGRLWHRNEITFSEWPIGIMHDIYHPRCMYLHNKLKVWTCQQMEIAYTRYIVTITIF